MKYFAYLFAGTVVVGMIAGAVGATKGQKVSNEAAAEQQLRKGGARNVKFGDAFLVNLGKGKYAYMRDVQAQ